MTRADFYSGFGKNAKWLGSLNRNGMPDTIEEDIILSKSLDQYERRVKTMLIKNKNSVLPGNGWPWIWGDSRMTDYSYFFYKGKVYTSYMGGDLFDPILWKDGYDLNYCFIGEIPKFPDMGRIAWTK